MCVCVSYDQSYHDFVLCYQEICSFVSSSYAEKLGSLVFFPHIANSIVYGSEWKS